jgi:hypothetical protein
MPRAPRLQNEIEERVAAYAWERIESELDERGYGRLPGLLCARECEELTQLFDRPDRFRSNVDMGAHAYGDGSYRYFAYPLPSLVQALRVALYPRLQQIANRWYEQLGFAMRYPRALCEFLETCHSAGQSRPTPLLLRYGPDGYNRMHQDVYGEIAFPLQVACQLSPLRTATDHPSDGGFQGGEFLISENRPRMQVRTEAIRLDLGEGVLFANASRPVRSARGHARAQMRHGLSRIHAGERFALGLIFHDAT